MEKRKLGWTGVELSCVGLGTWSYGGLGWTYSWGPQDDTESINTIIRAVESGINWIDTAAVYGYGHSEEVVGRALKKISKRPFIATKCGRVRGRDGQVESNLDNIRLQAEESLKRLGIEAIDLYQIHWPRPEEKIETAWNTIAGLIKEGKVRYGGVSNFNVEQLKRIQKISPVVSVQPPYSLLNRGIEAELMDYCRENNIGIVTYRPLQKGLLTGKFTKENIGKLPEGDHRKEDPDFNEPNISKILSKVDKLKIIAENKGITMLQLAVSWILGHSEITSAITGARNPGQVSEIAAAGDVEIDDKTMEDIKVILEGS